MTVRVLAKFGVYGPPSQAERDVLALADRYRRELVSHYHARHKALVDLRNDTFPGLLPALFEKERSFHAVCAIEREIKQYHSEVRDRNAVTRDQSRRLKEARKVRRAAVSEAKVQLAAWGELFKEFRAFYKSVADWKNVKSLDSRRAILAGVTWPERIKPLAELWTGYDLREKEMSRHYQSLGLHYSIRAEIVESSKPKLGKTGPGMRYRYHSEPEIKPWSKITVQFGGGGLRVADALDGRDTALFLALRYTQHKRGGDEYNYEVSQRVTVGDNPLTLDYVAEFHRELPPEAIIKRWTLAIEGNRRYVLPTVSGIDFAKPQGTGRVQYDLRWRAHPDGIEVAEFVGDHVNERLVLPHWLIQKRMCVEEVQSVCDREANEFLASRGAPVNGKPHQGVESLLLYVSEAHPFQSDDPIESLAARLAWFGLRAQNVSDNGSYYLAAPNYLVRLSAHRAKHDRRMNRVWTGRVSSNTFAGWVAGDVQAMGLAPRLVVDGELLLRKLECRLARARKAESEAIRCIESIYKTVAHRVCSLHSEIVHDAIDLQSVAKYNKRDLLAGDALPSPPRAIRQAVAPGKLKALLRGYGLKAVARGDVTDDPPGTARRPETQVFTGFVRDLRRKTGTKENEPSHRSQASAEVVD